MTTAWRWHIIRLPLMLLERVGQRPRVAAAVALAMVMLTFAGASPKAGRGGDVSDDGGGRDSGGDDRRDDREDDRGGDRRDDREDGRSPQAVVIRSITPLSAARGGLVTITGTGFGGRNVRITVGGVAAHVLTATGHRATFRVPFGVHPGLTTVRATNPGGHTGRIAFHVVNRAPQANAGPDQTVLVTTRVHLDGSASADADGDQLTFHWSFLSRPTGSNAVLTDASAVRPMFVADVGGRYTLQLIVNDGFDDSQPDTVLIDTQNSPPTANTGPDQTVLDGATVQLDGTGSFDVDHDPLRFSWSFVSKPPGSQATLTDPTAPGPAFVVDLPGRYVVQLIVNDGTVDSRPDTVTIDTENSRPVADAGPDQTVTLGQTVQLDGSQSSDVDHDPLSFRWSYVSRPTGSTAALSDVTALNPTFVPDLTGVYVVQLIVNDGTTDSQPVTAVETVNPPNRAPSVDAGPDQTITRPSTAALSGSVTDDGLPPGSTLTIGWSKVSGPGSVVFTNASAAQTTAAFSEAGVYVLRLMVSDGALSSSAEVRVTVNPANQAPSVDAGPDQTVTLPNTATLNGTVTDDGLPAGATLTITWSAASGPGTVTFSNSDAASTVATFSASGQYVLRLTANDSRLSSSDDVAVTVNPAGGGLPPDPGTVAPPVNRTVATGIGTSTEFLYTGANPIQTGVAPGTIELRRAAVVRGKMLDKNNGPLSGVTITVLNHPEFGQTLSRADGMFDMAVNGGGLLTVDYRKSGLLSAQRQVNVPWQDYVMTPDVVMILLDAQVTPINLNVGAMQVARGSAMTDSDGTRRATLLIPPGTTANLVMPDGSTQPISLLNVRATEYTVGPNGPNAMPAPLPPTSGYTYAVELSADEAIAAGAKRLSFNQPIIQYVENFLNFPVGTIVPVGFYDRDKAAWVPSANGRVIRITAIAAGLANVDSVGTGSLSPLVFTDAERQQLASLYSVGQELWRVPIPHFSPWDCNWPYGPPPPGPGPGPGPGPPPGPGPGPGPGPLPRPPGGDDGPDKDCPQQASLIECQRQVLGEVVPVTGTGLSLNYRSDRVPGRVEARTLHIRLSGPALTSPPPKRIELEIQVAGRLIQRSFATPAPNLFDDFVWDGKDAYGRTVLGWQPANIRVGNVYDAVYQTPQQFSQTFGALSGVPISGSRARQEVTLWSEWRTRLNMLDGGLHGLAGWSLSPHHVYDTIGQVLYRGDGGRQSTQNVYAITTIAGGSSGDAADGGPATAGRLGGFIDGLTAAPDGSFYVAEPNVSRVRKIDPNGIISTAASGLSFPSGVALGPDGSLYVAEQGANRIRRIAPNGSKTIFAGQADGTPCPASTAGCGDGGPATAARLFFPQGVAVGPDGSVYIADRGDSRVRRVSPDGIITTVAGTGVVGFSGEGEGGPATAARFQFVSGVAVGPDGSVFIADANRILQVGTDGIITRVAGVPNAPCCTVGDGLPAKTTPINGVGNVAVGPNGAVYFSGDGRVRIVADGVLETVAGNGTQCCFSGEGGPPAAAQLNNPNGIALMPDGSLIFADSGNFRVRKVAPALPGVSLSENLIPSSDGRELYLFSSSGRHLRTLDALTGTILLRFGYDGNGRLTTITDRDDKVTTIERNGSGQPTGIVSPYGQRTELSVDGNGYLSRIQDPAGQAVNLSSSADGLLRTLTDPRLGAHHFDYEAASGRLTRDEDAAGQAVTLAKSGTASGYSVAKTAAGQTTTFTFERTATNAQRLRTTFSDGTFTETVAGTDGVQTTTYPDGTRVASTFGPDPRWGIQAPLLSKRTLTTPGGRTQTTTFSRAVTLANPSDILRLSTLTDELAVDGHTTTTAYNAAAHTLTLRTPSNRTSTMTLDVQGRLTRAQVSGLEPFTFGYDGDGRVNAVTEGSGGAGRTTTLAYGSANPAAAYLARVEDALGRATTFSYDGAGRATQQVLPGSRTIAYGYDAVGNLTSLTPPGHTAHLFGYGADQQLASYTPPAVAGGGGSLGYTYDGVGRLMRITQPDGRTVEVSYDGNGRPFQLTYGGRTIQVAYAASGALQIISGPDGVNHTPSFDGLLWTGETWTGLGANPRTVSRTFDNALRTLTRTVDGTAITLQYDADSLLTGAGALSLTRHPNHGLVSGTTLGVVTDTRTYSGFGGLDHYTASRGGTAVYDIQYTRDNLGQITDKTETIEGVTDIFTYRYDAAGRLDETTKNGATTTFTYDGNGNRLTANGVTASYDGQDRLTQAGTTTYTSTANGERLTKTAAGQITTSTYDALGSLLAVSISGGPQVDYLVDGLGRRVGKKLGGVLVKGWLYDERGRVVAELDGSGAVVSRFVYASRPNVPDYLVRGGVTYRLVSDQLGSVRLVVKAADGAIAERIDYDAFGGVTSSPPSFQPFGFAGGLYDPDTRLVHFGPRDYDPESGRWTTKDPILFAGGDSNLYTYASNDPINRLDSAGLDDAPGGPGVCLGPPPDLNLGKPLFLDPKPQGPPPPMCPTCPAPGVQNNPYLPQPVGPTLFTPKGPTSSGGGGGGGGGGPLSVGPFKFSGGPNTPSLGDVRDKDARSWFSSFDLKVEGSFDPGFKLTKTPQDAGGPDPNGPNPKPQGPQCAPNLGDPDPLGCEN